MQEQQLFPFQSLVYGHLSQCHDPRSLWFYCPGVYFAFGGDLVKIGHTSNPNSRLACLRTPQGLKPSVFVFVPVCLFGTNCRVAEKALHRLFAKHRVQGEWFSATEEIAVLAASFVEPSTLVLKRYRQWFLRQLGREAASIDAA